MTLFSKSYNFLLTFLLIFTQICKSQDVSKCPENAERVKENPYEEIYQTNLIGGYRIVYGFTCSDQYLLFKNGNKIIDTISGTSFGIPYKNLGFLGADFKKVFVLVYKFGGGYPGNPLYFDLFEKKTAKSLLQSGAALIDVDKKHSLIIYSDEDVPSKQDKFIVLDVEKMKKSKFSFPSDIFKELGVCNRIRLKYIDSKSLIMEYKVNGKTKTKKYSR